MKSRTVIHLIDDDMSFRNAASRLLRTHGYVVMPYESAESYFAHPVSGRGCILLDVRMSGMSGLQTQAVLVERHNPLPIIFITGHGDIPMSVRAIKAGAEEFLTKPVSSKDLLAAIEAALSKYDKNSSKQKNLEELQLRFASLTPREIEVFNGVVAGKINKVIASQLGTAERTIKAHRHNAMEKMKASSLAELVDMARLLEEAS